MELLNFFFIKHLHRKVECPQALIRGFICELLYSFKDSIVLVARFQPFSDLRVSAFYIELVAMIARVVDQDRHAFAGTVEFHQFFNLEA